MFVSVSRRLALLNAAVVASVIALVGAGTFLLLRQNLDRESDHALVERADAAQQSWAELFITGTPLPNSPPAPAVSREDDDDEGHQDEEGYELIESGDTLLYAIGVDGGILASSRDVVPPGLPEATGVAAALGGREDTRTLRIGEDPARVHTQPVWASGRVIGAVQVAQGQRQHESELRLVGWGSLAGVGLGILIAVPTGLFLARRAMTPIAGAFHRQRAFVADASHELRTPLTLIRATTELIRQLPDPSPAEIRAELGAVLEEVDAMNRLVDDLLLLARADGAELALARGPVDLGAIARDAAEAMRVRANAAGVTFEVHAPESIVVDADGDRVQQVLRILLDNAIMYTPAGGSVAVTVIRRGGRGGVSVRDTGIGISPEEQTRVFDRFYRSDRARSRSTGGTGLGLAIASTIIEAHRGEIGLESQPGKGTTVWFTLPLPPPK